MACAVVLKLQLDVLKVLAYKFARAEIEHIARAEHRLLVARSERIELLQISHELGSYVGKFNLSINVEMRRQLIGLNVFSHILFKSAAEFLYILLLQRESHGIRVSAEVLQQVAT